MSHFSKIKTITKNFIFKGLLLSILILLLAMCFHISIVLWWYFQFDGELSTSQWSIFALLIGIFPIATYIVLGIIRCIKVLYHDVFFEYIQPSLKSIVDLSIDKVDGKIETMDERNFLKNVQSNLIDKAGKQLESGPKWIRKITLWVLGRISFDSGFLLEMVQEQKNAKEVLSSRVYEWLSDYLENIIDDLKPFWIPFLIPLHILFLIGLWFVF